MSKLHSSTPSTGLPDVVFSQRWRWGSQQPISFLMDQAVRNPGCISLAAGLVDQTSLPTTIVERATQLLLAQAGPARLGLQYGTTAGALRLREQVLAHFAQQEGCPVDRLGIDVDQVICTTGSQQLLSLVAEVLLDPGDIVLVAAPTYFVFLGTLNGVGARVVSIPTDEHGMQMEALDQALQQLADAGDLPRVKLIYAVSYYENPTGISLALDRRQVLVGLARKWSRERRILILEDAAYRELHFESPELPSLWGMNAERDQVIYTQTFSKSFSPGLRVGFGIVPRELVVPLSDRKGNEDFGSPNFNQHLLATVFEQGWYDDHVVTLRDVYRVKRDALLAAADRYFANLPGVSWVRPHGGLYVWMTLPDGIETGFDSPLFQQAVAEGVMYVPGELCYTGELASRPRNQMRLSFGTQDAAGLDAGMQRLGRAVRTVMARP